MFINKIVVKKCNVLTANRKYINLNAKNDVRFFIKIHKDVHVKFDFGIKKSQRNCHCERHRSLFCGLTTCCYVVARDYF